MGAGDCDVPAVDRSLSEALPERRILLLLSAFLMAMPVVMEAGMILACLVVVTALAVASLGVLGRLRDSKLGLRGTDASRALIVAMGTVGAAMDALLVLRVDSPPAAWVALTVVVALLALVTTFAAARASRWAGVCAVALMVVTGIAVHQMVPMIDVLVLHEHAAAALLAGHDPYAITFPDPYPPALDALFYGPASPVTGEFWPVIRIPRSAC